MLFKSIISLSSNVTSSKSLLSNDSNLNSFDLTCNTVSNKSSTTYFTRPNFSFWVYILEGVKGNSIIARILFSENLKVNVTNQLKVLGYIDNTMYDSYVSGKFYTVVSY
ncbi:hypothetical protein ACTFIR_006304 [Dictyostelium discoideum]